MLLVDHTAVWRHTQNHFLCPVSSLSLLDSLSTTYIADDCFKEKNHITNVLKYSAVQLRYFCMYSVQVGVNDSHLHTVQISGLLSE